MESNEIKVAEATEEIKEEPVNDVAEAKKGKDGEFKFFKNCSASLKKFSVIMFVINIFLAITLTSVAVILIAIYMNVSMLTLLALPLITLFVVLVIIARFISALIYGFAEIVENNEKK